MRFSQEISIFNPKAIERQVLEIGSTIESTAEDITLEVSKTYTTKESTTAQIKIVDDQIKLKVSVSELVDKLNSELKVTGNTIELRTGHFLVDADNLSIDKYGTVYATNGYFDGELHVTDVCDITSGAANFYATYLRAINQNDESKFSNLTYQGLKIAEEGGTARAGIGRPSWVGWGTSNPTRWVINCDAGRVGQQECQGSEWNSSSDERLKHDIKPLTGYERTIYSLKPMSYRYNNDPETLHHGFVAQDILRDADMPEDWCFVVERSDGYYGITMNEIIADIVATVQAQNERIKRLEGQANG